ncbi:F-box protein PP2-B15-like [Gastrolobium bilobum]|uniref:F-box protein PP2-B15-like n=1 Tax=Gastrolobium bilobum TaxID=150636 RepID=UPI002AB27C2D|nr:F-box protein PP2-B15-like [Gastrolobium bilobum]
MATSFNIETLPDDCVSTILSYTSPQDACRFSMVSSTLRSAADSDMVWRSFFPSDYHDVVSRAVNPLILKSSSYKHLFYALCNPLLLDGGNMSFKLDKSSGKKSYIISARELSIAWSNDPMYWIWRSMPESRFQEVAVLRTVNWLEIQGKIRTRILTPNTIYGAYLIMKITHREYGLDSAASEVRVAVANEVKNGRVYLSRKDENKQKEETLLHGNRMFGNILIQDRGIPVPSQREDDGWMEIELGEFFSGEADQEVKMSLMEVGYQLKGGLIVEGIEVRPKQVGPRKLGFCNPLDAELWGILKGLELAWGTGARRVELECDSEIALNTIQEGSNNHINSQVVSRIYKWLAEDWDVRWVHTF